MREFEFGDLDRVLGKLTIYTRTRDVKPSRRRHTRRRLSMLGTLQPATGEKPRQRRAV
jgi:hypothetical protein